MAVSWPGFTSPRKTSSRGQEWDVFKDLKVEKYHVIPANARSGARRRRPLRARRPHRQRPALVGGLPLPAFTALGRLARDAADVLHLLAVERRPVAPEDVVE